MKNIIKTAVLFAALAMTSCSSNDSVETIDSSQQPAVAMITKIDGVEYNTPPQIGGNLAENSGGSSFGGSAYFLLKGYKNLGARKMTARVGNKIYNIYLAIPKNDLSVGTHNFSNVFTLGEYYADLDITGVVPSEDVNTDGGFIKVVSYDAATKMLKGTFTFTTNDGIDFVNASHVLVGSFEYKLP